MFSYRGKWRQSECLVIKVNLVFSYQSEDFCVLITECLVIEVLLHLSYPICDHDWSAEYFSVSWDSLTLTYYSKIERVKYVLSGKMKYVLKSKQWLVLIYQSNSSRKFAKRKNFTVLSSIQFLQFFVFTKNTTRMAIKKEIY